MKVKRLIEILSNANPEATVLLHNEKKGAELIVVDVVGLGQQLNDVPFPEPEDFPEQAVVLKCAANISVKTLINESAKIAIYNGVDEFDYYKGLLEDGITPALLREQNEDVAAWHMENYCREHGLM